LLKLYSGVALRQLAEVERENMFEVYALYNKKHNKIYIGQTANLDQRLELHNKGIFKNSFTGRFDGGWELIYVEPHDARVSALKREKQLKSYRGREFLRKKLLA